MILSLCLNPAIDVFLWLNQLKLGEVQRIQKEVKYPGGKGVHVALALKELGQEVTLLGFWGGPTGEWIKSECQKRGVKCLGPTTQDWTRSCFALKGEGDFDDTEILGQGPKISNQEWQEFLTLFESEIKKATLVTMSGSLPQGLPQHTYAQLIKIAHDFKVPSMLDCTGESFQLALKEKPLAIHLNLKEAQDLTGILDTKKSYKKLIEHTKWCAVTAGAEGLYLSVDKKQIHAKVIIEKVYSAIGSGDCLLAGLAAAYVQGLSVEDSAKLAVACGAANCLREELGMIHKKDVDQLIKKVEVSIEAI